mmetsp:Transcript_10340/g.26676  ORF Transcript_10340/g.26676 Transcript_10340/m.26676 type:complete len:113 (-) Transcript_10340:210-548(-)
MPLPPHSLHMLRHLPCSQKALPPHSLHVSHRLPCSQKLLPPHSLHRERCLPCSHTRRLRTPPAGLVMRALACVRRVRDAVTTAAGCSSSESEESSSAFAVGRRSRALAGAGT